MSHRESLARSAHDRNHVWRGAGVDAWDEPETRAVVAHGNDVLVAGGALALLGAGDLPAHEVEVYLGRAPGPHGGHRVGVVLDEREHGAFDASAAGREWRPLREVGTTLSDADVGLATELVAMGHWHATHRFSPRTGAPTEVTHAGWVRRDPGSGQEHFPRTDAAIIVAVIHVGDDGEDRILLGHNSLWDARRYSLLAGFVEPGETLEAAVAREVAEETGVTTHSPVYFGSQPWPFPASLMVGFFAQADSAEISVDTEEILDARWFSRRELREAVAAGQLLLPGDISIAGHLLRAWEQGKVPGGGRP